MADQGLTSTGFRPLSLAEIQADLQAALQQGFGGTGVDLSSQSFWGQLIGIMANANSSLWEGLAAIYSNSYPGGASGVAVDNILALNAMARLPAKATATNPSPAADGQARYFTRLVLRGSPGTVVPAGTLLSNGAAAPATFALDNAVTIAPANNEQQVVYFNNQATSGSFVLTLTSPAGDVLSTPPIAYNTPLLATGLVWLAFSQQQSHQFRLVIDGNKTTDPIIYGGTATFGGHSYILAPLDAQAIQSAIAAIAGYESVTVTGDPSTQFNVFWNQAPAGTLTATGDGGPDTIQASISSLVSALATTAGVRPFTDVVLQAEAQNIALLFGQKTPLAGMPSTAGAFVPLAKIGSSTLARGSLQTLSNVAHRQLGSPAQAPGSATCTTTGAVEVLAGQLTTIVNPIAGLASVTNELDCLTGRDLESDAAAIARLSASQGTAASGSLAAILARVKAVSGVTQAVGFQNTTSAAQQIVAFASAPSQGQFNLRLRGQATALLPFSTAASDLQAAISALPGYGDVTVSGSAVAGFVIDFGGEAGKQPQPLCTFPTNTTGVQLSAYFGRGAHAVELVVQGGQDAAVAAAILGALPAGIGTYSSPVLRTTANLTAGEVRIAPPTTAGVAAGQQVLAAGIPVGCLVAAVNNGVITLTQAPVQTASSVPVSFSYGSVLADAEGNNVDVTFSRAVSTLIWAEIDLLTDTYNTPGQPSSGFRSNAKFNQSSVSAIQQSVIDVVNSYPIGALIVANGTNSLGGSFRQTPGILDVTIKFDRISPPVNEENLQLSANEAPLAETFSVTVSVT